MENKINVYMIGKIEKEVPNTCSCGISKIKGQNATEFEVFNELKDFLLNSDIKNDINLKFINIDEINNLNELEIKSVQKYGTPIISVGNKNIITGKIQNVNIYIAIKNFISSIK